MFKKKFNSSKCKTSLRMAMSRLKLLKNKKGMQLELWKKEVATLLQGHQDATARIRVEHVIREENTMAAYDIIELFCELLVARLQIIESQKQCPLDLKEAIGSLIFASSRCADVPELDDIKKIFGKKYGKEFVAAAEELRKECNVNRTLIEKLSAKGPTGAVKLKHMKEIGKEYLVDWDSTESEAELLQQPEKLIQGPSKFSSASVPGTFHNEVAYKSNESNHGSHSSYQEISGFSSVSGSQGMNNYSREDENNASSNTLFKDVQSAAQVAAESAYRAVKAAEAASLLSKQSSSLQRDETGMNYPSSNPRHPVQSKSFPRDVAPNVSDRESYGMYQDINKAKMEQTSRHCNRSAEFDDYEEYSNHASSGRFDRRSSCGSDRSVNQYHPKERRTSYGNERSMKSHNENRSGYRGNSWQQDSDEYEGRNHLSYRARDAVHSHKQPSPVFDESEDELSGSDDINRSVSRNRLQPHSVKPSGHESYENYQSPAVEESRYARRESIKSTGSSSSSHVHPKLPDYDELAARFEALKTSRR